LGAPVTSVCNVYVSHHVESMALVWRRRRGSRREEGSIGSEQPM